MTSINVLTRRLSFTCVQSRAHDISSVAMIHDSGLQPGKITSERINSNRLKRVTIGKCCVIIIKDAADASKQLDEPGTIRNEERCC